MEAGRREEPEGQSLHRVEPNPLRELELHGQSVWLDSIRRSALVNGELQRLIEEDGLAGVTSNPSIFEKAISAGADYDAQVREVVLHQPEITAEQLYERVVVKDIQMAADLLRPVWEETSKRDGYVSLEVSPPVAHDTEATMREVHHLWGLVDRPNVMIKIPGTEEGIPAIERCLADGININVTLMFSAAHYDAVAEAYLRGLARLDDPSRVSSVASIFVSRMDTKADELLKSKGEPEAVALLGRIAIANAKLIYQHFTEIFHGERFGDLHRNGARVQRVLWASTSTKNPNYPDTLYVDNLIGPETVNTMPPETLAAFRDHGKALPTVEQEVERAETDVRALAKMGWDVNQLGEELQKEGLQSFGEAFNKLVAALERKKERVRAGEDTS